MLTLVFMKIAADLAVYYTFAGFFAVLAGASGGRLLLALAMQAVILTLSYPLRRFGLRRAAPLALLALCWFMPGAGPAEYVAILPPALYVAYLAFRGLYEPGWAEQTQIFSVYWKVMLVFAMFGVLFGAAEAVRSAVLPFAVVGLMCCVLLMRSLRHDPEVYCQAKYQAVNVLLLCAVGFGVLFLSSDLFLGACLGAVQMVYRWVITPVLMAFLYLLMAVIRVIVWLVSLLPFQFSLDGMEQMDMGSISSQEMLQMEEGGTPSARWLLYAAAAIGIVIAGLLLFFLFRALARRGSALRAERKPGESRTSLAQRSARGEGAPSGAPAAQVRAQYRKFLKLAASRSLGPEKSDTSLDVHEKCRETFDARAAGALRELYLCARYDGRADRQDARRAKELYVQIKKKAAQEKRP